MIRLKDLRKNSKISQNRFAKEIGVAQNTVSNWENENRLIDAEMLTKISDYFNVTTDYLLGRESEQKTENPTVINDNGVVDLQDPVTLKFAEKFNLLTDEQRDMVIAQMEVLIKKHPPKQ